MIVNDKFLSIFCSTTLGGYTVGVLSSIPISALRNLQVNPMPRNYWHLRRRRFHGQLHTCQSARYVSRSKHKKDGTYCPCWTECPVTDKEFAPPNTWWTSLVTNLLTTSFFLHATPRHIFSSLLTGFILTKKRKATKFVSEWNWVGGWFWWLTPSSVCVFFFCFALAAETSTSSDVPCQEKKREKSKVRLI